MEKAQAPAGKFEPKEPPVLNPPKDDAIEAELLAKYNGEDGDRIWSTPLDKCKALKPDTGLMLPSKVQSSMSRGTRRMLQEPATMVMSLFSDAYYLVLTLCKVFAGKDASRALAKTSLKAEDCSPEWQDLSEQEKKVLDDWYIFFSKRYNIVGQVRSNSVTVD